MTEPDPSVGSRFLSTLARTMNATAAVYVPGGGAALVPIADGARAGRELDTAGRIGANWIAAGGSAPATASEPEDRFAFAPIYKAGTDGVDGLDIAGVAVFARPVDLQWTDQERALLQYSVATHAGELEPRAAVGPGTTAGDSALDFEAALRSAAGNDELSLRYQPEIDLSTGRAVAVEALLRWHHPRFGELGPEWFIDLAERTGLIKLVGAWVINESIRTLAGWNERLPGNDVLLRVNVSPVQMAGEDVAVPIAAALTEHGVPGRQVCIELTENAQLGDLGEITASLRRLRELGVTLAIDDLATGYSTLSLLRFLPVDVIKIDRSLVSDIDTDLRAQTIVAAVIGLAVNLGLGVVAEGVETAAEAAMLQTLGCRRAQGHHLGRPVRADDILELLRGQRRADAPSS